MILANRGPLSISVDWNQALKNVMLNAAYKESKIVGPDWINKISSLLCRNLYANLF